MRVTKSMGLVVRSLNTSVVTINADGNVVARGNGFGNYVEAEWVIDACNSTASLGTVRGFVNVTIPPPDDVIVTVTTPTLTSSESSNVLLLATLRQASSAVTVKLKYGSIEQDRTDDPRTIYDVSGAGELFSVKPVLGGGHVIVSNNASQSGSGNLAVRFTHVGVSKTVTIKVVTVDEVTVFASPSPAYTGSTTVPVSTLSVIGTTGVYEQATLANEVKAERQHSD